MGRKCLNCGYERKHSDLAPEYECPKCGAIYEKVEAAMGLDFHVEANLSDEDKVRVIKERASKKVTRQPQRETSQDSKTQTKLILGLIGSIILFVGILMPIGSTPVAWIVIFLLFGFYLMRSRLE